MPVICNASIDGHKWEKTTRYDPQGKYFWERCVHCDLLEPGEVLTKGMWKFLEFQDIRHYLDLGAENNSR